MRGKGRLETCLGWSSCMVIALLKGAMGGEMKMFGEVWLVLLQEQTRRTRWIAAY